MTTDRMKAFQIFIGTWNTTGEVMATDAGPASTLSATDVYEWLPGRHFVVHRVDARFGPDVSRSMEVIGFDETKQGVVARSFDDRGGSNVFDVELEQRHLRITGQTVRFEGQFDTDDDRLSGLWELKSGTAGWQPWIRLELIRA